MYFPRKWQLANVVAIPKPHKDLSKPESFRPISLLSNLGKIFEKIILRRLNKFIDQNNTIPAVQFGFRPGHSTVHQLVRVTNYVKGALREKESTGMVLFDGEKAFDTVWHDGLVHKLRVFGFPMYLIKLIASFLVGRKYRVGIKNSFSNVFEIIAGVPQGSCLSPTLYNIYIADLPLFALCQVALFADDLAIYVKSNSKHYIIDHLQSAIERVDNFYRIWRLKLNAAKTQCIYFTRRRKASFLPSIQLSLQGNDLEWAAHVRYLGITLDKKLTFARHIENTIERVNKYIRVFYSLINRRSSLSEKNKIILFKVIFQAIILYGCPVWINCAHTHIKKLQISQNKVLKMILNKPFYFSTERLHSLAMTLPVRTIANERKVKFFDGCAFSDNALISNLQYI